MERPHLAFEKPETRDEIGQSVKFDVYPWGLVISMSESSEGNRESCSFLLEPAKIDLLREFLKRIE